MTRDACWYFAAVSRALAPTRFVMSSTRAFGAFAVAPARVIARIAQRPSRAAARLRTRWVVTRAAPDAETKPPREATTGACASRFLSLSIVSRST